MQNETQTQHDQNLKKTADTRSFLMHNLPKILEHLTKLKQQSTNIEDQDDLFGEVTPKETLVEWDYNFEKLKPFHVLVEEKNSLGLYVSGNPLAVYQKLEKSVQNILDRDDIFLVLIDKIKKITTRKNINMYALEIVTNREESRYEGIVFPKNIKNMEGKLGEKDVFWIRGKILEKNKKKENVDEENSYDEIPKIAVENVCLLTQNPIILYENEEVQIAVNRQKMLEEINWKTVKENPHNFLKNEENTTENGEENLEQETQNEQIFEIKIPEKTGVKNLGKIKSLLHTTPQERMQKIKLIIQLAGKWRKSKNVFWADYEKIQEILRSVK